MSTARAWFLSVCGVGVAYATVVAYASFTDGAVLPIRVDSLIRASLAAAFVVTALWWAIDDARQYIVSQVEARIAQRLAQARYADDSTGEIPRVRVVHSARAQLPADNVVAFELGRQSAQSLRAARDD